MDIKSAENAKDPISLLKDGICIKEMHEHSFTLGTIVPSVLLAIFSYFVSWLLVYKFGWRFPNVLSAQSYPDNMSFTAFGVIVFGALVPIVALFRYLLNSR